MAQKKKQPQVRIKFEDGTIRKINFIEINDEAQKFLEEKTGLLYGRGDFYAQTIGVLYSWICKNGPDDEFSDEVLEAAELVILRGLSEMTGGYAAVDEENMELLVYSPDSQGHFVILTSNLIEKIIKDGEFSYANEIFSVNTMGKKVTVDELREELKVALKDENYELAAKLRDKLSKRK
jgi:hypothetical protein